MNREARRRRHEKLVAEGWERRSAVDEQRVSEIRELYETLGMETHIQPGILGDELQCDECFCAPGFTEGYMTVYTRGPVSADAPEEDAS